MDLTLQNFFNANMTDVNYANSVARWLTVQTENAQQIISSAASVLLLDAESVEDYVETLSSDLLSTPLIYFPESDLEEAECFTAQDVLEAYGGVTVEGLSEEKAIAIIEDLAGSTASLTAASIGINELCSTDTVSPADLIAAIESQVGGVSDQMLSVTSVIAPALGNTHMAVRDKVKTILSSLGIIGNDDYEGFGPIHSDNHDMTGVSGVQALTTIAEAAVVTPWAIIFSIQQKILTFLDKVFGGLIRKAANVVSKSVNTFSGVNDACKTREEGKYTDLSCDNADLCITLLAAHFTADQLAKLSHKYALHINAGFGVLDVWFADDTKQVVNIVIHWNPIDIYALMRWANDMGVDPSITGRWNNPDDILASDASLNAFVTDVASWIFEMETPEDREAVLNNLSLLLNTQPQAGMSGVNDIAMFYGILATQIITFVLWSSVYDSDFAESLVDDALAAGFHLYRQRSSNVVNADLVRLAGLSLTNNGVVHNYSVTWEGNVFTRNLMDFIHDILDELSAFSLDVQNSLFIPYYYVSCFQTGKYSIMSDQEVQGIVAGTLFFVGLVIVSILAIKIVLTIKKNMWVAQTSLDYQAFELDVAKNPQEATRLYKKSCRLSRATALISMITGSAKSAVSKVSSLVTGLGNTITSRVRGIVTTGEDAVPEQSITTDLDTIKALIKGS